MGYFFPRYLLRSETVSIPNTFAGVRTLFSVFRETCHKVYQTGDLANMDGLPAESKRLLPSLFTIRDSLYSLEFRRLVQSLTGSGPLSGEQIDLSVNAFGHTGHLLCHDDVIGTRKVRQKVMYSKCYARFVRRSTTVHISCTVLDKLYLLPVRHMLCRIKKARYEHRQYGYAVGRC